MNESNQDKIVETLVSIIKLDKTIDRTDTAVLRPLIRKKLQEKLPDLEMTSLVNLEDVIISKTLSVRVSLNKEA